MRRLIVCGFLGLASCSQGGGWRAEQIAAAEAKIRMMVDDPTACFTQIQLTGDEATGQTCGAVIANREPPRRFIVYIDGTAGPYIEGGQNVGLQQRFESAWTNDCIKEGYTAA